MSKPIATSENELFGKFDAMVRAVVKAPGQEPGGSGVDYWAGKRPLKFVDMFCGIGGFHSAADDLGMKCVFACDIDDDARTAYEANYGIKPASDITQIEAKDVPDHDILFAGFPCQPFSIIGDMKGFSDARGTLFFELARIIEAKKPAAFVLENVRQLASHNGGKTLQRILEILRGMGYTVQHKILNALNFGVPQKRERILIVGFREEISGFAWPDKKIPMPPLSKVLEKNPDERHFVSDRIRRSRHAEHTAKITPSIWHENKGGNIASHPISCALRAGASYNYLLVNGDRRLTVREMLRLQGFPESFKVVCNDSQTRKQAGNAVPVPMVRAVLEKVLHVQRAAKAKGTFQAA